MGLEFRLTANTQFLLTKLSLETFCPRHKLIHNPVAKFGLPVLSPLQMLMVPVMRYAFAQQSSRVKYQDKFFFLKNYFSLHLTAGFSVELNATFGEGLGPIQLSSLTCRGTEERLVSCTEAQHPTRCTHAGDVGVVCQGEEEQGERV